MSEIDEEGILHFHLSETAEEILDVFNRAQGGFQREVQHYQAFETVQLSRIALENLMESETLVLDRITSPTKKPKALNSAGVALRAGTQASASAHSVCNRCVV